MFFQNPGLIARALRNDQVQIPDFQGPPVGQQAPQFNPTPPPSLEQFAQQRMYEPGIERMAQAMEQRGQMPAQQDPMVIQPPPTNDPMVIPPPNTAPMAPMPRLQPPAPQPPMQRPMPPAAPPRQPMPSLPAPPNQGPRAPDGTPVIPVTNPGYTMDYLTRQHGMTPHAAAGVIDNLQAESGFRPDVLSGKTRGDGGTAAYGFQWRGDRLRNFEDYVGPDGPKPGTLDHYNKQLDFAIGEELNPASPYADPIASANRGKILDAPNRTAGANAFTRHFERPHRTHLDKRAYAAKIPETEEEMRAAVLRAQEGQPATDTAGVKPATPATGEDYYPPAPSSTDRRQGLFAGGSIGKPKKTRREKMQEGLADFMKQQGRRTARRGGTRVRAPQATFASAQSQPWMAAMGSRFKG